MVSTAMMEPRRLSWRSVTDAMPTPRSRTMREALMLWLKGSRLSSMRAVHLFIDSKLVQEQRTNCAKMDGVKESEDDLNFLFRKMVSKTMVKGMMANLVIW
jgi:hypothetical protein